MYFIDYVLKTLTRELFFLFQNKYLPCSEDVYFHLSVDIFCYILEVSVPLLLHRFSADCMLL